MVLRLTPHGRLLMEASEDDASVVDANVRARISRAFERSDAHGLLHLAIAEIGTPLPPLFAWWREFAARYVELRRSESDSRDASPAELASFALTAPVMPGSEYVTADVLDGLWHRLDAAFVAELAESGGDLEAYLKSRNPAWNVVGRVHFNLAENRSDADAPFAFMATYTTGLSAQAKARHVPLGQALREYAGAAKHAKLLALLVPVQRAAASCAWVKDLVDSGDVYHPLRWLPSDAARFLASVPELERAGVVVRMPATWSAQRPPRPRVSATVGARQPTGFGLDALFDFRASVVLEGEALSDDEIAALLAGTESLVWLRGRWVEVDAERLQRTMREFRAAQELAEREGLTFAEAMRMLAGFDSAGAAGDAAVAEYARVTPGPWLAEKLHELRASDGAGIDPGPGLKGTLRPYQRAGVRWLRTLSELGLGACLADDMGLGKTIQVLALLLMEKSKKSDGSPTTSLLVAPASLLANWSNEVTRFAPSLRTRIVHPSAMTPAQVAALTPQSFEDVDLAITSYGSLLRIPSLLSTRWRFAILDEAQAIKNPGAKQTRAVKRLLAGSRVALTGTPVENHLGDLWSLFDFINPGLLGSATQFSRYAKTLAAREHNPYGPLRELVRPYILRRMKTDRAVIADLPDKTEVNAYCALTRRQAALYEQAVSDLSRKLEASDGIARQGLVLSTLVRLKQICNHPSQWLGDDRYDEAESGKFARLREIAEAVASRQDKMLVFTQFRELVGPLEAFLASIFGRPGLVLHGNTPVKKREAIVSAFASDETLPFFVLSLKAGGSGLTLTAASHVVHFDRWWNPAVENQATDRAFRIGQKKNVLVHKFVCRGTVEEKVDALIESKRKLSDDILMESSEIDVMKLSDADLMRLVSLDLRAATGE